MQSVGSVQNALREILPFIIILVAYSLKLLKIKCKNSANTVFRLKSGLACERVFGESPFFLEKSCFAKTQKSGFFGQVLF